MIWPVLHVSSIKVSVSGETRYSPASLHLLDASVLWTVTWYWFGGRDTSKHERTWQYLALQHQQQCSVTTHELQCISKGNKCTSNILSYRKLLLLSCLHSTNHSMSLHRLFFFQPKFNPFGNKKEIHLYKPELADANTDGLSISCLVAWQLERLVASF